MQDRTGIVATSATAVRRPASAIAVAALCGALAAVPASAEMTPECRAMIAGQRLSLVVPNGPGGGYDTYARALAPVIEALSGARTRVENLPAAGGRVAHLRLFDAGADEWVIMLEEGDDLYRAEAEAEASAGTQGPARFRPVAIFHTEPAAWVVRPGFDPMNPPGGTLVAGSSSRDDADEWVAVSALMGFDWKLIDGYAGSSAMALALLGGDVDVISVSLGSALRTTRGGDAAIGFVYSEGPHPDLPGVPYLAGAGSVTEARLAALEGEARARAEKAAGTLLLLGTVYRMVFAPVMPADRAACLDAVVEAAVLDPAFRTAAEAEGRKVAPVETGRVADVGASIAAEMAEIIRLRGGTN